MTEARLLAGLMLIAALAVGCPSEDPKAPPSITAQGFELAQPREAMAGGFSDVRIRFEVPVGIEHLVVRERSFEVDLAKSPEPAHFPLFGIDRRVWSKRDVTLDFSNYLNEKIQQPGAYVLLVEVVDRDAGTSSAELKVVVDSPEAPERDRSSEPPADAPAGTEAGRQQPSELSREEAARGASAEGRLGVERPFRLQRVGVGPVTGGELFGITWKTVDEIAVVIRVKTRDALPTQLGRLDAGVYEKLATRADLTRALDRVHWSDTLEIPTANDAAAGTVVAVVRHDERYLLRADHSTTSLSDLGTTVTLSGSYVD